MLFITLLHNAVAASLSRNSTSVWNYDQVFFPLKVTTEFLATIALIYSSPVFDTITKTYIYERIKLALPYYTAYHENAVHLNGTEKQHQAHRHHSSEEAGIPVQPQQPYHHVNGDNGLMNGDGMNVHANGADSSMYDTNVHPAVHLNV